jgi:hypothetical protein
LFLPIEPRPTDDLLHLVALQGDIAVSSPMKPSISGTVSVTSTFQQVLAASNTRRNCTIQNQGTVAPAFGMINHWPT